MHFGDFDVQPSCAANPLQEEVLCRLESLVRQAGDLGHQCRLPSQEAALAELLRGQDGYAEPSTPASLAPFNLELISLPKDLSDAPRAEDLLQGDDRRYLEVEPVDGQFPDGFNLFAGLSDARHVGLTGHSLDGCDGKRAQLAAFFPGARQRLLKRDWQTCQTTSRRRTFCCTQAPPSETRAAVHFASWSVHWAFAGLMPLLRSDWWLRPLEGPQNETGFAESLASGWKVPWTMRTTFTRAVHGNAVSTLSIWKTYIACSVFALAYHGHTLHSHIQQDCAENALRKQSSEVSCAVHLLLKIPIPPRLRLLRPLILVANAVQQFS